MTKDEALALALEALDNLLYWDNGKSDYDQAREAITAIKQARALDKKAENARELGLDYEPVCDKDPQGCWSVRCQLGKKCKNTPPAAQPAPVQPMAHIVGEIDHAGKVWKPAQRQWVGLTDEECNDCLVEADPCECLATPEAQELMCVVEAKLKEKNESHRQHVTDGNPCWCDPENSYTDPETGASVIVHKEPQ
jgi:hypothetical protein